MKLPSQKYRKAVESAILEATLWRSEWQQATPATEQCYQYRLWYFEALQTLSNLGLNPTYSAEEIPEMIEDAKRNLELCQKRLAREAARQAEAAEERLAELEQAEAELAELRTEVLESEGSSVNPADYTMIALWGENLGSKPYYIEAEQTKASRDGAPLSAIYKNQDGRWVTVHEIQNEALKEYLLEEAA